MAKNDKPSLSIVNIFISVIGVLIALSTTITAISYYQGRLDAVLDLLGEEAKARVEIAKNEALTSINHASQQAKSELDTLGNNIAIDLNESKEQSIALIADAQATPTNKDAVLRIFDYFNRSWCNETGNRVIGTTYRNKTNSPIEIAVIVKLDRSDLLKPVMCQIDISINDEFIFDDRITQTSRRSGVGALYEDSLPYCSLSITIPPRSTYKVNAIGEILLWNELTIHQCE